TATPPAYGRRFTDQVAPASWLIAIRRPEPGGAATSHHVPPLVATVATPPPRYGAARPDHWLPSSAEVPNAVPLAVPPALISSAAWAGAVTTSELCGFGGRPERASCRSQSGTGEEAEPHAQLSATQWEPPSRVWYTTKPLPPATPNIAKPFCASRKPTCAVTR